MTTLEFFWDVASPYTYLASTQIPGLRARTGAQIVCRPFLLGGVFKSTGNVMPAEVPAKAAYMLKDLARWRDRYQIPFRLPGDAPFPLNSVLAQRVATAADLAGQGEQFMHAVMRAYWGEAKDISDPAVIAQVVSENGFSADLLAAAQSQAVKDRLRANSDEAVERGAFGAPAFFLGGELYWGNDQLPHLEALLQKP